MLTFSSILHWNVNPLNWQNNKQQFKNKSLELENMHWLCLIALLCCFKHFHPASINSKTEVADHNIYSRMAFVRPCPPSYDWYFSKKKSLMDLKGVFTDPFMTCSLSTAQCWVGAGKKNWKATGHLANKERSFLLLQQALRCYVGLSGLRKEHQSIFTEDTMKYEFPWKMIFSWIKARKRPSR